MMSVIAPLASFVDMFDILNPNNWFRQVPEGMEFLGVLFARDHGSSRRLVAAVG